MVFGLSGIFYSNKNVRFVKIFGLTVYEKQEYVNFFIFFLFLLRKWELVSFEVTLIIKSSQINEYTFIGHGW